MHSEKTAKAGNTANSSVYFYQPVSVGDLYDNTCKTSIRVIKLHKQRFQQFHWNAVQAHGVTDTIKKLCIQRNHQFQHQTA